MLGLISAVSSDARAGEIAGAAGARAHDFALVDVNPQSRTHGQTLRLAKLAEERGVVLEFIASWCSYCRKQLPALETIRTSGRAPIVFMAADEEGGTESLLLVAKRAKLAGPILLVPEKDRPEFERHFGYDVLPAAYVIDRQGKILKAFQGAVPEQVLLKAVDRAAPAASAPSP